MANEQQIPYVVNVRAGSAAGQPLRFQVTDNMRLEATVEQIIQYGLSNTNKTRKNQDVIDAINGEMRNKGFGYTANEQAVEAKTPVKELFKEAQVQDRKFMALDLIVASRQKGGYYGRF